MGWMPGESAREAYDLRIPPDSPGGTYQLLTGLDDPVTGQRLPVTSGPAMGLDRVGLTGLSRRPAR